MKSLKFCLFTALTLLVSAVLFVACKDKDENEIEKEPDTLSVSPKEFDFSADGNSEKMVTVTTNVSNWTAKKSNDWVILREEGDKLYITVQNHTDTENGRAGTVTVSAGNAKAETISIKQKAKEINSFSISPSSLFFEAKETSSKVVTINTNAESWGIVSKEISWLAFEKRGSELKVTTKEENTETAARTETITLTAGNAPDITLTITQAGAATTLSTNPTSLTYAANETGEKTVTISTNATGWESSTTASWISLSKNGNTLKVSVKEQNTNTSPRNAEIKITAGNASEVIVTVTQAGATTLSASPTSLTYAANETGEKTVTISTNATGWESSTTASWISLSKSGNTLKVNAKSKNTSTSPRSAEIKITAGNAPEVIVTVTQRGAVTLSTSPTSLSFAASEKTGKTVTVTTSASNWRATENSSWISISKSGNKLTVTTLSNNPSTSSSRSADVTITAGDNDEASVTLRITQDRETGVVASTYSASGSPKALASPGPSSWSGAITPTTVSGQKTYRISNWGNSGVSVVCNEKNGNITIAQNELVARDGIYYGYFRACFVSGTTLYYFDEDFEYPVYYNRSTQTLDFSGTIDGKQILVGVIGLRLNPEVMDGFFTELYANAKLKLTATSSAQFSGDVVVKSSDIGKYTLKKVSYSEFIKISGAAAQ